MNYFEKLIEAHPYEKPMYFKKQAALEGKFYKETILDRMALSFRRCMFPNVEKDLGGRSNST